MIIDTSQDPLGGSPERRATEPLVRHPVLLAASLAYLALLIGVWVTLRTYAESWWIATLLLLSPRWPWAVPLVVLLAVIAIRRAWGHLLWCAAASAILAFPILGIRVNVPAFAPPPPADAPAMRLLSLNVHRQQVDPGELLALIAREKPDLVALQDWSSTNDPVFAPMDGETSDWHRRREGELLVASRFPIRRVVPLEFPDTPLSAKAERGAAAGFEIDHPSGAFWLVNVHFASPHGGLESFTDDNGAALAANSDRRWGQSEQALGFVEALTGPVIVTGDFNTTDDSPIFLLHWGGMTDAFSELGFGIGYTYVVTRTQIRIDHVLGNREVHFTGFRLLPRIGSPHRPMVVDLRLLGREAGEAPIAAAEIDGRSSDSGEAERSDGR